VTFEQTVIAQSDGMDDTPGILANREATTGASIDVAPSGLLGAGTRVGADARGWLRRPAEYPDTARRAQQQPRNERDAISNDDASPW
jgi:hypothetical protein